MFVYILTSAYVWCIRHSSCVADGLCKHFIGRMTKIPPVPSNYLYVLKESSNAYIKHFTTKALLCQTYSIFCSYAKIRYCSHHAWKFQSKYLGYYAKHSLFNLKRVKIESNTNRNFSSCLRSSKAGRQADRIGLVGGWVGGWLDGWFGGRVGGWVGEWVGR